MPWWSVRSGIALLATLALAACTTMTPEQQGTAIGVVAGSVAGHLITRGNPFGMTVGAVVGGIIGHQVGGLDHESPSETPY